MKKTWNQPMLEVLDVKMTMKWHNGGGEGGGKPPEDPEEPVLGDS